MRLPPDYVTAIKEAAREAFGASAVVRLFGSRLDDNVRGGDIDLHVEADANVDDHDARIRFRDLLFRRIPPQQVDVIVTRRGTVPHGFERIAYRDGVPL